MTAAQRKRRAEIIRIAIQGLDRFLPPYPNGMDHVITQLRYLDDHDQDSGQRRARMKLILACENYAVAERGHEQVLESINSARQFFEMQWVDELGEMIEPRFI